MQQLASWSRCMLHHWKFSRGKKKPWTILYPGWYKNSCLGQEVKLPSSSMIFPLPPVVVFTSAVACLGFAMRDFSLNKKFPQNQDKRERGVCVCVWFLYGPPWLGEAGRLLLLSLMTETPTSSLLCLAPFRILSFYVRANSHTEFIQKLSLRALLFFFFFCVLSTPGWLKICRHPKTVVSYKTSLGFMLWKQECFYWITKSLSRRALGLLRHRFAGKKRLRVQPPDLGGMEAFVNATDR